MNAPFTDNGGRKNPFEDMMQSAQGALGGLAHHKGNSYQGMGHSLPSGGAVNSAPEAPAGNPYADYISAMQQMQAEQQRLRDERAAAARKAQQAAYDNSMNKLRAGRDMAQQEAYINYMMNKKNLGQQLSAQGITGGMAESTAANMYNNYGNSRNQTERSFLEQAGDLEATLNNNLAAIEQERLSGEMADTREYYTNLMNMAATNAQKQLSVKQGGGTGQKRSAPNFGSGIQKSYYSAYQDARENGMNDAQAVQAARENRNQYLYSLVVSGQLSAEEAYKYMS